MQRAPTLIAFLLFLALCASIAYWLLQWMAPPPRPVAAPPQVERASPPVAAAANLFGGRAQAAGMANVQLKGIIRAGKGSIAIIAVEGKPARALATNAEVGNGLSVKEINARSVVLSDRGAERELTLPAFGAQEGAMSSVPGRSPEPQQIQAVPPQQPQPQAQQQPAPPPQPPAPQPQSMGPSGGGATAAGGGAEPNAQPPMYGQRAQAGNRAEQVQQQAAPSQPPR